MTKHFNAGNVWGAVKDSYRGTSRKGTHFLWIRIDCSGEHGSFTVFGRLWGQEKIDGLLAHIKAHPGETIRFRGFFEQYTQEITHWNYTLYAWEPAPEKPKKAAFVLRGKIVDTALGEDNTGKASLQIVRPGKNGHKDIEENLDIYTPDPEDVLQMQVGDTWELKGYLKRGMGEDEFGVADGQLRPFAERVKQVDGEQNNAG